MFKKQEGEQHAYTLITYLIKLSATLEWEGWERKDIFSPPKVVLLEWSLVYTALLPQTILLSPRCKPPVHGCGSHPSAHCPAVVRKPSPARHPPVPWLPCETSLQKKRHQDRCSLAVWAMNIKLLRHGSGVEMENCSQSTAEQTAGSSPWMVSSKFPVYSPYLQHSV